MTLTVDKNVEKYEEIYRSGYDKKYPNLDLVRLEAWYFKKNPGMLLDFGAGTGANTIHMIDAGYQVVAMDAAEESIDLMRRKIGDRATIMRVEPDATALPFADATFDYVVCMSVLSLLETKARIQAMINEFFRVLKPGGKIIADINGPEAEFSAHGQFIDEDTFEYKLRPDQEGNLRCYCPRTAEKFAELFHSFVTDDIGFSSFEYIGHKSNEFIVLAHKPQ